MRAQTPNLCIYGELGKTTLDITRKERILKYWCKIINSPDSLIHAIYRDQVDNNVRDSWASNVKRLINDLGFNYLLHCDYVTELQLAKLVERLHDQYYQSWYSSVDSSPKLANYKLFKTQAGIEKYNACVLNEKYRIALSRFRCSAHSLAVEEGRYRNIERAERKCIFCPLNIIEDEYHFLLVCPFYREIRKSCLPNYYCRWPSKQKFIRLLQSSQTGTINKLAKYLFLATAHRNACEG